MFKSISLLGLFLLFISCNGEKKTNEIENKEAEKNIIINNVKFPKNLTLNQTELVLNGGGIRKLFFLKIFAAGLYLPVQSHDAKEIINADEPTIIRLHLVSTLLTSERLSNTIQKRLSDLSNGEPSPFQSRIDILTDILKKEKLQLGDECDICYTPNEGIRLVKNGVDLNVLIKGLDFKKALWGNWLSETPADEDLKKGLLGL